MRSINMIFGCHSHQPVGNFDFVFEESYRKSYLPFIEVLERYPGVHVTLHYTGPLLDWFLKEQPGYLARLRALVTQGQVEIMGGGYYEPLLCAIPERDAIAQIARMQQFCTEHLGARPRGMWLTERVWEPQMARTLARAGVEYTALDDTHFLCSGVTPEALFGYHTTEDEGQTLNVFPILEKLRYLIPFGPVAETIEFLREHATEDGTRCAVFHDDGEKFGVWPHTYHSVYEEGWLEDFFTALTENADWLKTRTYAEYLASARPAGRSYITCASYFEMMEWALPTALQRKLHAAQREAKADPEKYDRYGQFLRGGFWRGFLSKYEESNNIQKRMLRVSQRVERLRAAHAAKPDFHEGERLLHEGQCNCAYWHGAFGGVYLNHLRTALYERLIAADVALDRVEFAGDTALRVERLDFDCDGNAEIIAEDKTAGYFFSPTDGGTLFELDFKPRPFNFLNSLARREEPYHDALRQGQTQADTGDGGAKSIHDILQVKEEGLDRYLVYDPYRRASLRDHVFTPSVSLTALAGCDAAVECWSPAGEYVGTSTPTGVHFQRESALLGHPGAYLRIEKTVEIVPTSAGAEISTARVAYVILNAGTTPVSACFGVEFCVNLLTGNAHDRYLYSEDTAYGPHRLGTPGEVSGLNRLALRDDWMGLEFGLDFGQAARVFHFPIDTVSQSEAGQERVHQGCVVIPTWNMALNPGEIWRQTLSIDVRVVNP